MWSTFFVTDEEGRTVAPGAAGTVGGVAGPAPGAGGLASLMGGRGTFGGKRRRTTSAGHGLSEAQEGKVTSVVLYRLILPTFPQLWDYIVRKGRNFRRDSKNTTRILPGSSGPGHLVATDRTMKLNLYKDILNMFFHQEDKNKCSFF